MKLTVRQSYLAMFYFIDEYYWENTKDEILGNLLSGFNPYLWIDSNSGDPAAWEDWINVVKKITNEDVLTLNEAFNATKEFIIFHQEEFGFELQWLIDELNKLSIEHEAWLESVEKALDTVKKGW